MQEILLNDFKKLWEQTSSQVLSAVKDVGESGWYILGKEVDAFESSLAKAFKLKHAISCANGMDAIEISLRALGIKPGDKVLTTPLSAFATTLAIIRTGAIPYFVDVDSSGLIDLDKCESAILQDRSIRYIVPVHLYGHSLNLKKLSLLKDKYDLIIVEDCAQSILASFEGAPVGSVGQCSATSFYPTKNLGAIGDAGALLTNTDSICETAKSLRNYGQSEKYVHDLAGLNSRLDELQASILNKVFLPQLSTWTESRRSIAHKYSKNISNSKITAVPAPQGSDSVWHLFPLLVAENLREQVQKYLKSNGIQSAIHYPKLINDQKAITVNAKMLPLGEMPLATRFAKEVLSIPIHPYLTDSEVNKVIETINTWNPK